MSRKTRKEPGPDRKAGKPASAGKAKRKKTRRARRRPGWLDRAARRLFVFLLRMGLRAALGAFVLLAGATLYYYLKLPAPSDLFDGRAKGSVTLLDRNGDVFAWRGAQYDEVRPGAVSPWLIDAILAAEDRRFYSHFGLDPRGLARAMVANARAGGLVQGGSTLTQQVAKNVFLTSERTIERKLKEIPVALALELKFTKDEILSIYLNRVYLGAGAVGFEAAAQRYFSKSAREVTLPEAAMLAGLLKAPSRFAPTSNMGRAQGRAAVIINAMKETGAITPKQAAAALAGPATLSRQAAQRIGAHFADWVMESGPAFLTQSTAEDVLIRTTFDPGLQRAAEAALTDIFTNRVRTDSPAEAAIVVMDLDGKVRALVGGRDARANTFNRATQALRQTGSAFKPIVYAAALEAGFSPRDVIEDRPLTMDIPGSGRWSPKNYGGGFAGPVTLTEALSRSINTVAVRLSEKVGRDRVRALAVDMGLTSPIAEGPAVALGVSEATLLEMTGVYADIANGGALARPRGIEEVSVRGDAAPIIAAADTGAGRRVLSARAAAELTGMMEDVIRAGTGRRASLGPIPIAGKTGTTQGARDAWFIGFSAHYVVGVWMGKDDNAPLVGVTGGGLPAAIWRETMARIHKGLPVRPLKDRPVGGAAMARGDDDGVMSSLLDGVFNLLSGDQPPRQRGEDRRKAPRIDPSYDGPVDKVDR